MLLVTSAYPHVRRLDASGRDIGSRYVGECLASWQANGFRVVSVHRASEESRLAARYPGVEYRFVDETDGTGDRKTPSMAAIVSMLPENEAVGIVNGDVFMAGVPGLAAKMARAASEAVLVGHRWEVPSLADRRGRLYDLGVDFLAFRPGAVTGALERIAHRPFQFGLPWWDYALTIAAGLHRPLSLIVDPIFLHHSHEQVWLGAEWHKFADISAEYLKEHALSLGPENALADELARRLGLHDLEHGPRGHAARHESLARLCQRWIHAMSEQRPVSFVSGLSVEPPSPGNAAPAASQEPARGSPSSQGTVLSPEVLASLEEPRTFRLSRRINVESPISSILIAAGDDLLRVLKMTKRAIARRRRWRKARSPAPRDG